MHEPGWVEKAHEACVTDGTGKLLLTALVT
jgi:hypothetical protein